MVKATPDLKGLTLINNLNNCVGCIKGKLCHAPVGCGPAPCVHKPMVLIHTNVCGPFNVKSIHHKCYFVSFINNFSQFVWVYFITTKDEVFSRFKDFLAVSPHCLRVCTLQSDNGSEYTGSDFQEYLECHGIKHQPPPPYTPEYNGVAKQFNRTIVSMAHLMLANSSLPCSFWSEAITTAIYINNCAPTKANQGQSLLELWMGVTPSLSHLHTFSSPVYLHIDQGMCKLDNQVKDAIHLGPTSDPSQHQLWVPSSWTITISHNVCFVEESGN